MSSGRGKVILVGAGPGDPGLISVRGREAIESADVIIYDFLAVRAFDEYAPENAEKIYVGKKGGDHVMKQPDINKLLVEKGSLGLRVVRLKGGDPYVFGRGSEEIEELAKHGIEFEVVPGIPAAVGAAATAGIPLTDRRCTSTLAFVTGHEDPTKPESSIDWESLARGIGTIVFYMGVKNLPDIVEKLISNGRDPRTLVSIVRWATTPRQEVFTGELSEIADVASEAKVRPPALVIVGEVNQFAKDLDWFSKRPLAGRRIVVTRSRKQASRLLTHLRELGADTIEMPTIDVEPPESWEPIDDAIETLTDYDWIVFTSVNGVDYFMRRLHETGGDSRSLASAKIATIGPATTQRLAAYGLKTDFQPERFVAEAIVEGMRDLGTIKGWRFLLPRSDIARDALPDMLREAGAVVDDVAVYRTVPGDFDAGALRAEIESGKIDAVTFTSSSTARYFVERIGKDFIIDNKDGFAAISIGPITSATLRKHGIEPAAEAKEYTIPGLTWTLVEHFRG